MRCEITADPIDAARLMHSVRSDADGAVLLFCGVVRDHDAGRAVESLRYEAYEEMASDVMERICADVVAKYDVGDVAVSHRVGHLAIGEVSVAIAVAAPHRDAAYQASREIIERLKREVPIWKRERYSDGEERWLEGSVPPAPESE
jgi:molybdopterin synthase catalytic subunit